ncbi:hypothetical protein [Novosphingobium sp. UBA1939]|uniref:hypothetical protein n=1 Tax=Novosphingobium sp. UBA1939 TaxID=1946982 RepID=UPI0025E7F8F6|nr:hypothetical protein [Novosphingobium sp. UBA1939]
MTDLKDTLAALSAKATQGEWGIWFEQINGKADAAIQELIEQVHHTDPIGNSLVMLDADGKCPAITGCGPTSAANAAFIVALVNAYRSGELVPVPRVEKLIETLAWYGEQARLARLIHSEGDTGRHALQADGGKKARAFIAAMKGEVRGDA